MRDKKATCAAKQPSSYAVPSRRASSASADEAPPHVRRQVGTTTPASGAD